MRNSEINTFALKWIKKFSDPETSADELIDDRSFPDACFDFGFEMDCGQSFCEKYPNAFGNKYVELQKVLKEIDDVHFLGSAIFSNWRYYNHWAYSSAEIKESEAIAWFVSALGRLEELTR